MSSPPPAAPTPQTTWVVAGPSPARRGACSASRRRDAVAKCERRGPFWTTPGWPAECWVPPPPTPPRSWSLERCRSCRWPSSSYHTLPHRRSRGRAETAGLRGTTDVGSLPLLPQPLTKDTRSETESETTTDRVSRASEVPTEMIDSLPRTTTHGRAESRLTPWRHFRRVGRRMVWATPRDQRSWPVADMNWRQMNVDRRARGKNDATCATFRCRRRISRMTLRQPMMSSVPVPQNEWRHRLRSSTDLDLYISLPRDNNLHHCHKITLQYGLWMCFAVIPRFYGISTVIESNQSIIIINMVNETSSQVAFSCFIFEQFLWRWYLLSSFT